MNIQNNFQENGIQQNIITREDIYEMLLTERDMSIINNISFLEHFATLDNGFMSSLIELWDMSEKLYNETEIRLLMLDKKIKKKFNKMIYYYTNGYVYFGIYESMNDMYEDVYEIGGLTNVLLSTKSMLIQEIKIHHVYIFELKAKLSFIKHQMIKIEVLLKREHNSLFDRVFVILMEQFKMDYLDIYNKMCKYEKKFKGFNYYLNDKFNYPDVYNIMQMHYI